MKTCSIEGCDSVACARGWCSKHYQCWQRNGGPEVRRARGVCTVDECERVARARGYCPMHWKRVRNHGSTDSMRNPRGELSPRWKGDQINYHAAHQRVRNTLGSPSQYPCADYCGALAQDWAYRHGSPAEQWGQTRQGGQAPYSPDPMDYDPLCRCCHRARDRAEAGARMRREFEQ